MRAPEQQQADDYCLLRLLLLLLRRWGGMHDRPVYVHKYMASTSQSPWPCSGNGYKPRI